MSPSNIRLVGLDGETLLCELVGEKTQDRENPGLELRSSVIPFWGIRWYTSCEQRLRVVQIPSMQSGGCGAGAGVGGRMEII